MPLPSEAEGEREGVLEGVANYAAPSPSSAPYRGGEARKTASSVRAGSILRDYAPEMTSALSLKAMAGSYFESMDFCWQLRRVQILSGCLVYRNILWLEGSRTPLNGVFSLVTPRSLLY